MKFRDRYVLGVGYPGIDPSNPASVEIQNKSEFGEPKVFKDSIVELVNKMPKCRFVLERIRSRKGGKQ